MPNNTGTPARVTGYPMTHYLRRRITFRDDGQAVTVGVIPAGAIIINAGVVVTTAFNDTTTNVLDIGTSADPIGLATDLALGTIGRVLADELGTSNDLAVSADTTIVASTDLTGTGASAGDGIVFIEYLPAEGGV